MGTIIYRGSTPTIKFKPLNNVSVSDLGTPKIAIAQELVYLEPSVTINADENFITAKLTEEESLRLVENVPTTAQQIWVQESGNIIRYPTHQLQVYETIMEQVTPIPEPEPVTELINLHPFFTHSCFEDNGYFTQYLDDGGIKVEEWRKLSTPWNDHIDSYMFTYNAVENPQFEDFTIFPVTVASLFDNSNYYLWVNVVSEDEITVDFNAGSGYSFKTVNGEESYSASMNNTNLLFRMVAENSIFNQPLCKIRVRNPNPTETVKIGMALYPILDDRPESEYKRYIPYDGGDV